jgi:hypothetical protein
MSLPIRRTQAAPWLKDALWRKAQAVPSLDLGFADNKSLVDSVSGQNLITFSRASSATYIGSDGLLKTATTNEPRFDHNPTTGESLGLLVEEQRTNLCLQSQAISLTTPWSIQSAAPTVAINAFGAPDGTTTATRVTFAAADSRIQQQYFSFTSGVIYTFSAYARPVTAGALNTMRLAVFDGSQQNGSDTTLSPGWQRVSFTFTASSTTAFGTVQLRNATNIAANDIYLWGAQLETGSFSTSYIPTTTAATTRAADVASITGTAFSSWYRQDEGTVFADSRLLSLTNTYIASFTDNSNTNHHFLRYVSGQYQIFSTISGTGNPGLFDSAGSGQLSARNAYAFKNSAEWRLVTLGSSGSFAALASSATPVVDRLIIGQSQIGNAPGNLTIRRLTYFPARLPSTTLQRITQ